MPRLGRGGEPWRPIPEAAIPFGTSLVFRRILLASSILAASVGLAQPAGGTRELQHLTVITDSVAGSLAFDPAAERLISRRLSVDFELRSCRRLTTESCGLPPPPNALQLIRELGHRAGPNVVIAVGYNDDPTIYARGIDETLAALRHAGVQHVFWLTLRASRHPYVESNAAIWAAAKHHSWVVVVDWNSYSRTHPEWFQPDAVHLQAAGVLALAALVHRSLVRAGIDGPVLPPIEVSLKFPTAAITVGFEATLTASGGSRPYRWTVHGLPPGLTLKRSGEIKGPAFPDGSYTLIATARDAHGRKGTGRFEISVEP